VYWLAEGPYEPNISFCSSTKEFKIVGQIGRSNWAYPLAALEMTKRRPAFDFYDGFTLDFMFIPHA
jgi:hypothetical protein